MAGKLALTLNFHRFEKCAGKTTDGLIRWRVNCLVFLNVWFFEHEYFRSFQFGFDGEMSLAARLNALRFIFCV